MMNRRKKDKRKKSKKTFSSKKKSNFFQDENDIIDFKRPKTLAYFLTDHGKIMPRRVTGLTQIQQTQLVQAVKRARHLALLPYTLTHAVRD